MTINAARLLGFAFASADLLLEIDAQGRIAFAMGAAVDALGVGEGELAARPWVDLVEEADRERVAAFLTGLSAGVRAGPIGLGLRRIGGRGAARRASLSAFRLAQLGDVVSCAVTLAPRSAAAEVRDVDDFLQEVSVLLASPGAPVDLVLLERTGLASASERPEADALLGSLDAILRAGSVGETAARLADERFALVRDAAHPRQALIEQLQQLSARHANAFSVDAQSVPLPAEQDPALLLKAMRYALQSFIETGANAAKDSFQDVLRQTLINAQDFSIMVREQRFDLAYQPIVDLRSGQTAHFEVLARFGEGSPQKTILMAEALDLIEDFDLAVAGKAAQTLREPANRGLRLAINLSARSLVRPFFLSRLWGRLGDGRGLGGRLLFEITETAHIGDIPAANLLVQEIRRRGFKVCLDDFGAGSASLAYLHGFTIDTVKIDGQYVRELSAGGRDAAVIGHLVKLCADLGVTTIAEMVETQQVAETLRVLGVGYGQGWLFGRPAARPELVRAAAPPAQRGAA